VDFLSAIFSELKFFEKYLKILFFFVDNLMIIVNNYMKDIENMTENKEVAL